MTYKIFSGPGVVHFIEGDATVVSGQPNQEEFTDETESVARVLELDENFFPDWDREETYQIGDRVKFGEFVYRALQQNDARSFELPDLLLKPDAEVATPTNRQARWLEVYEPPLNYEEQSFRRSIQRTA
jgi:hypothetical protein